MNGVDSDPGVARTGEAVVRPDQLQKTATPTNPPPFSHTVPTCAATASGTLGSSETMTEVRSDADRTLPRRH